MKIIIDVDKIIDKLRKFLISLGEPVGDTPVPDPGPAPVPGPRPTGEMYGFTHKMRIDYAGPISIDGHHNGKYKLPKGRYGPDVFGRKIKIKFPDGYVTHSLNSNHNYDHRRNNEHGQRTSYNYRPGNNQKKNKHVYSVEIYHYDNMGQHVTVFYNG